MLHAVVSCRSRRSRAVVVVCALAAFGLGCSAESPGGTDPRSSGPTQPGQPSVLPDAGRNDPGRDDASRTDRDTAPPSPSGDARDVAPSTTKPDAPAAPDAGSAVDPGKADTMTAACPAGAFTDVSWLPTYLTDVMGRLTGKTEHAPGQRLTNRGSPATRKVAQQLLLKMFGEWKLTGELHEYGSGANVLAVLPSTTGNPERVIFGAHFDTVTNTPGASDNATGTAAMLAAARAAQQIPCRSRTLIFVGFDEEEVGLIGSRQYASKLTADGVPVHSVHSIDQIGWDEDRDRLIELERAPADLARVYQDAVTSIGMPIPLSLTPTGSTDHVSFRPRFKAIGITEEYAGRDTSPHRHRSTDSYDTVSWPYLKDTTAVVIRAMELLVR